MSLLLHERGIHIGPYGGAGATGARFQVRATVALARSAVAERLLVLETVHAGLLLVSKKELPFSLSSGNAEAG